MPTSEGNVIFKLNPLLQDPRFKLEVKGAWGIVRRNDLCIEIFKTTLVSTIIEAMHFRI